MTQATTETCYRCGNEWGVTMTPREYVLCTECVRHPKFPAGEVRVSPEGTIAVCFAGRWDRRWKVIGNDPHNLVEYGWRMDFQVADWRVVGNVHDLVGTGAGQ